MTYEEYIYRKTLRDCHVLVPDKLNWQNARQMYIKALEDNIKTEFVGTAEPYITGKVAEIDERGGDPLLYLYETVNYMIMYTGAKMATATEEELLTAGVRTLTEVKDDRVNAIRNEAREEIESVYPLWKQLNIRFLDGHTQAELDEMVAYINAVRKRVNDKEAEINKAKDITEVKEKTK